MMASQSSPYNRPPRDLDYGAVARRQITVAPLRKRVEAGAWARGRNGLAWEPVPAPLLRRRQRVAAVVTWGLLCLVVFLVFLLLAPWLSLVVP